MGHLTIQFTRPVGNRKGDPPTVDGTVAGTVCRLTAERRQNVAPTAAVSYFLTPLRN